MMNGCVFPAGACSICERRPGCVRHRMPKGDEQGRGDTSASAITSLIPLFLHLSSLTAPLYRSSHLAVRFALGLATGQEWSHFYYLNGGAEIARVEVPDWLAEDSELLALSHAMLVKQCQLGLGYPVATSEAHEQAVISGHDSRVPGGVPPHHPHAPGTARTAHLRISQGVLQAPALGLSPSSRQAGHPHAGQVSDWAASPTGRRHAGGSSPAIANSEISSPLLTLPCSLMAWMRYTYSLSGSTVSSV